MRHIDLTLVIAIAVMLASACAAWAHEDEGPAVPSGQRPTQVLRQFPINPLMYNQEAAQLLKDGILEKYGREEWAAVVMAMELHQHVGIYTVVGAKMGVHGRELLNAPNRAVHVAVETGVNPPMSCAIDGIQASIGSTFAQGLLSVDESVEESRLAATFEYEGRKVRLELLPEYQEKISAIVASAIEKHGNLTHEYFHEIERRSYDIWAGFDRTRIFQVQMDTQQAPDEPARENQAEDKPAE